MAVAEHRLRPALGAGVVLVIVVSLWLVVKAFNGDFGDRVDVRAGVAQVGDSLEIGDVVVYRDVIVGEVSDFAPDANGGAELDLHLEGPLARQVPSNVTALAVPANLFGATQVLLVPPAQPAASALTTGQRVPADRSPSAAGLQTALSDAYDLIEAVHPAQLNAALTAISTALSGNGTTLNALLRRGDRVLRTFTDDLPRFNAALRDFATVTSALARQAPSLVGSVRDLLAPAAAIIRQRGAIDRLFGIVPRAAGDATRFLRATGDDFITVVGNEQPFLEAISADPQLAGRLVSGLKKVADAVNSAATGGRIHVQVSLGGLNIPGSFQTQVGRESQVLRKSADPALYGAADCPRYPGASGSNCPSGERPAALTTAYSAGVPGSATGGAAENAIVRAYLARVGHLPLSDIPDGMGIYIAPLLRGVVTVLK